MTKDMIDQDTAMSSLEREELRLLKLLQQNLEAQLAGVPLYQKYLETKALIASRSAS